MMEMWSHRYFWKLMLLVVVAMLGSVLSSNFAISSVMAIIVGAVLVWCYLGYVQVEMQLKEYTKDNEYKEIIKIES